MFHRGKAFVNHFFNRRPLSPDSIPILIFGIALLAFGIKTLDQGFFHDDWHHIYYANYYGLDGLKQFLFFDSRPFAYLVYGPLFSLLGFNAFNWHVLSLVLRFLTVLVFFGCLNLIWPTHKKENGLVAALFLIYPVFQLQPISAAYILHWVAYLAFILSLVFMIRAVHGTSFVRSYYLLALIFEAFHLLMIEYFAGIELIRPFLLLLVFRELPFRERIRKALVYWIPFFVILAAYAFFRASFSQLLGHDRNSPVILLGLFSDPINSLVFLLQSSVRDVVDILLASWNATYDPSVIDFSVFTNVWVWGFAVLTGIASFIYFSLVRGQEHTEDDQASWPRAMLGLGLILVIVGLLPTWISGRSYFQVVDLFDDRFALPVMFGASMVWVGGIFHLVQRQAHRYMILCAMLGLALGLQLRTNVSYERGWQKQTQFYWQLYWRAPYIEPGTAFISEGEILPYMGIHPTSYAINSLYPLQPSLGEFNYAFFASGERVGDWDDFRLGSVLTDQRFGTYFEGSSRDTLTIFYAPENGQCLWILRPEDARIRNMPELTYQSLPVSNLGRIKRAPLSDEYPPRPIFGAEPPHTWCFYYQKAELARQYDDWLHVTKLWEEAQQGGLLPGSGPEYMVFIEGFANTDQWSNAADLTIVASKYGNNIRPALCEFWDDLVTAVPGSSEKENAHGRVAERLQCEG